MYKSYGKEAKEVRRATYPVLDILINRCSPRAMTGEMISEQELMSLFEAAHWAPSAFNIQPWRFLYAFKGTDAWDQLFSVLVPFNQEWVQRGSVLILVCSDTIDGKGKLNGTHAFDTGAAWENLALQANSMGLVAHGMSGFDYDKARELLKVPAAFAIHAMIALGKPGDISVLPEAMQKSEVISQRKPLSEIIFNGKF